MSVSIVITAYNHWDLTSQLLTDLYTHCLGQFDEIVLVDNASTDKTTEALTYWAGRLINMNILKEEHNIGFLKAANAGVSLASGDIVILISNDVRISDNKIITEIKQILGSGEYRLKNIVGGKLYNNDTGWNTFDGKVFPYLEGWLLAFWKKDWDKIGGFDELYAPNDFEDVDFSTKALSLGYALYRLEGSQVFHAGSKTIGYNPERETITKINREKFRKKWLL